MRIQYAPALTDLGLNNFRLDLFDEDTDVAICIKNVYVGRSQPYTTVRAWPKK